MGVMNKEKKAFTANRKAFIANLRKAADDLDTHFKSVNRAKDVGTAAIVIGSAAIALGVMAAPVTAGVSTVLSSLTALAVIGKAVSSGAQLVGDIIEQKTLEQMQKQWIEFQGKYKKFCKMPEFTIDARVPSVEEVCKQLVDGVKSSKGADTATTAQTLGRLTEVVATVNEFINASVRLSYKTECPAGQVLRALADAVEEIGKKKRFCFCCF